MKNARPSKPTRKQKEAMKAAGINWENWLVAGEDSSSITVVNKTTDTRRRIKKC